MKKLKHFLVFITLLLVGFMLSELFFYFSLEKKQIYNSAERKNVSTTLNPSMIKFVKELSSAEGYSITKLSDIYTNVSFKRTILNIKDKEVIDPKSGKTFSLLIEATDGKEINHFYFNKQDTLVLKDKGKSISLNDLKIGDVVTIEITYDLSTYFDKSMVKTEITRN